MMMMKLIRQIVLMLVFAWVGSQGAVGQLSRLFTSDNGLSNSQINQIYQDRKGFIWIATEDGLNQFDGTRFTVYRHQTGNPNSIASNFVHTVFEDTNGNFWVGTINGLQLFDRMSNSFKLFPLNTQNDASTNPHITSILQDKNGYLWVCTSGNGITRINPQTLELAGGQDLKAKLGSVYLTTIYEDRNGMFWIGSEDKGLTVLNPATNSIDQSLQQLPWMKTLADKQISAIVEDQNGNVVIGTLNGGLGVYMRHENRFKLFEGFAAGGYPVPVKTLMKDATGGIWIGTDGMGIKQIVNGELIDYDVAGSQFSIKKMKVHSLLLDQQGNIWAGLFHKGVMMLPLYNNKFEYYGFSHQADYSIGNACVMAIAVNNAGGIWTGTDGNGLIYIDPVTRKTKQYTKETGGIPGNTVMSLALDKSGSLWVGTYLNGLARFDPSTGRTEKIGIGHEIENDKIVSLATDAQNAVWIGTYGKGVYKYTPSLHQFAQLNDSMSQDSAKRLTNNWVNVLEFDNRAQLWIGTFKGVDCYNPSSGIFTHYNVANGLLCDNVVYCMAHDKLGNVWIGTSNGLTCIDKERKTSKFYTSQNGLPGNVINGIEEDANGDLWISTNAGLSRYAPSLKTFTNYYSFEGLQSNEFRRGAAFKSRDGKLYFGGINGITAFYPQNIGHSRELPDLYFTDFKIFNQSVSVGQTSGGKTILEKSVMERPTVTIQYSDNVFSIEFISLEYTNPEKMVYSYMMEGFDNDWKTTDVNNRIITYTNLSPGNYTFHVVASDNYSTPKKASLSIRIMPPWWRTWWAFIIYLTVSVLVIYFILKEIHHRVEQTHLLMEAQNAEKINEARLQLFANISHEIRTPLTLIVNPLEKLRSTETNPEKQSLYDLIYRNALRILRLMTQLMDIRKIDKGQFELRFQQTDLVAFTKDVMTSFEFAAKSKNIRFEWDSPHDQLMAWIDRDNFDKVLFNLISNAFKFTSNDGEITVSLNQRNSQSVEIAVHDNGIGIDEELLSRVFERFFQVRNDGGNGGWGIGLHLSQKLVEMHHGAIAAKQRQPKGTSFVVTLPLGNGHLMSSEMIAEKAGVPNEPYRFASAEILEPTVDHPKQKGKPRVVIAEDDDEIRSYLIGELSANYHVLEAQNGKRAWALVTSELPALVLSDVMMPEMSGLELCRKIKTNANTSHIPVVLLTALGKDEEMVEGLEHGADHYLAKPFNMEVLKSTIARAIESRHALKVSYSRDFSLDYGGMKLNSADDKLMAKLLAVLQKNISDPSMSVETLSREIGISRVHLHRKLKELSNQSPRDFIKHIRLTQAAHLLTSSHANVSEVAYAVGFSSHAYFTNCFRDQFGISPTDFVEKFKTDPSDPIVKQALQQKEA